MTPENRTLKALIAYGICFILSILMFAVFPNTRTWILILILHSLFLILPACLRFPLSGKTHPVFKKPEIKDTLLVILLTACFAPLAGMITSLTGQLLPGFTEHMFKTNTMVLPGGLGISEPAVFLLLALLPAVTEEFFFRGFMMQSLENSGQQTAAILLIPAFLFALMHRDPYSFTALFIYGIILGIIMLATRSLWLTALSHLLNNSLSLLVLRLYADDPAKLKPTLPSLPAVFLMTIPLILLLIILTHLLKRHRDRQHIL